MDGLVGTAEFATYGLTYAFTHSIPNNTTVDIMARTYSEEYGKFATGMDAVGSLILEMSTDAELRDKVATNLLEALDIYVDDIAGENGGGVAGYQHGVLAFDALLTLATAGGGTAKGLTKALKEGGESLKDLLKRVG